MINKNNISYLFNILLVVIILLCWKACSNKNATIADKDTLLAMDKYSFDTLRDSKGRLIAKQEVNTFNNRKTIEHLLDTIEGISKIKQQGSKISWQIE